MKKLFLLFLLTASFVCAQDTKFAWITDLHIGYPKADNWLSEIVKDINSKDDIKFAVISGDIAEKGYTKELDLAKSILDNLDIPYYIVPGNHDVKWSESGTLHFSKLWKSDKFSFEYNGLHFLGMPSGMTNNSHAGHFSPENIRWLDEQLKTIPDSTELYFICHHPLDNETDNWFEITNRLARHNVKAVLVGHGHINNILNFNGIPGAMGRTALGNKKGKWVYTIVNSSEDSLVFYKTTDSSLTRWGAIPKTNKLQYTRVDSASFLNYGARIEGKYDLLNSAPASLITYRRMIFSVTKNGQVNCIDRKGRLIWENDLHSTILSRPVIADGIMAVGTIEGELIILKAKNGTLIKKIRVGSPVTSQLAIIDYTGDKAMTIGKKHLTAVIAGTASGNVNCYELESLAKLWETSWSTGMIQTKPLYCNNKIIFGSWDSYLYCIDSRTGALNWKWIGNKSFYSAPAGCTPVTDGNYVYIISPDKYVTKLDMNTGEEIWRNHDNTGFESIGLSENNKDIIIKGMSNKIHIISANDGKQIKEVDIPFDEDLTPCPPLVSGGKIVMGLKNGIAYSLDKDYNAKKLFFAGTSALLDAVEVDNKTIAISNIDGRIIIFRL